MAAIRVKTGYFPELSEKEECVAILKGFGYKEKQIADMVCRSEETIKNQKASAYLKLGVNNMSQLTKIVVERLYNITIDIKDFVVENSKEIISISLLCIYLLGHFNCDLRRCRTLRIRENKYRQELLIEES